jgi:hypothetical protein
MRFPQQTLRACLLRAMPAQRMLATAETLALATTHAHVYSPAARQPGSLALALPQSATVGRALPGERGGLEPVHRRTLCAVHEQGLAHTKPHRCWAQVLRAPGLGPHGRRAEVSCRALGLDCTAPPPRPLPLGACRAGSARARGGRGAGQVPPVRGHGGVRRAGGWHWRTCRGAGAAASRWCGRAPGRRGAARVCMAVASELPRAANATACCGLPPRRPGCCYSGSAPRRRPGEPPPLPAVTHISGHGNFGPIDNAP